MTEVKVTGTDVTVMVDGTKVYPADTPVPPDPTTKPVLAITTLNGTATTGDTKKIEGTCTGATSVKVDAGPTDFGTASVDAQGKWSKDCHLITPGLWTITAHATNSVGTTDSNSVQFQVSNATNGGGGGGGTSDNPPSPQTRLSAGADRNTIQNAINACPAGGSVVFAAGSYNFGGTIRLKAGVTVWADGVCTVTGAPGAGSAGAFDGGGLADWVVGGKQRGAWVLSSMINATGAQRWVIANAKFQNLPSNGYDGSCVRFGSANGGVVTCCDFFNCQGNNLGMYSHNAITVDGCYFDGCRQPLSYQFSTDGSNGNDIKVIYNTFLRNTRACMEMGPDANKQQMMRNLVVNDNWFDDANPTQDTNDQGASLPISLVATNTQSAECKRNYIRRGDRPLAVARPHPAIEFAGPGPCEQNTIDSYMWEGFAYHTGYVYQNNKAFNAPWKFVVGTGGGAGTIVPSQVLSSAPAKPPQPHTSRTPTAYYPWNR